MINNSFIIMNTPKYSLPNRSLSPLRGSSSSKPKYYSSQDVNKIVRNCFQPKIQYLMVELQQRQQIIAKLNAKLDENDKRLLQQSTLIENYIKKQRDIPNLQSYIITTINQLINDKMKQHWQILSTQIKKISEKVSQKFDQQKLENIIQNQIQKIKENICQYIDNNKKKSNSYWQKIKEALNKINARMVANQKDILDINLKIQEFQSLRNKDRDLIVELQSSKSVVKNLIQLKKSVENIYENYQTVLKLQKGFKQTIEEQSGDSLWNDGLFFRQKQSSILPQQFVGLEYSKDDVSDMKQQIYDFKQSRTQPAISPIKTGNNQSLSIDIAQKTTPFTKNKDHSQLFSLNTSQNQMNSRIQNNTLLINLSLQTRKQMTQGVRQRLLQLIQTKNWPKPLQIHYDQKINYLRNSEGNYLFDLKCNMFKVSPNQLIKLEEERIVTRKKRQLSNSKVKLSRC